MQILIARKQLDASAGAEPTFCSRVDRTAAAATEFALVLPFLGLMFAVVLDFGRVYFATQTLQACAFAGALQASGNAQSSTTVGTTQAAINSACANGTSLNPPLASDNVAVVISQTSATVTITYNFPLLTPILNNSGSVALTRSVSLNLAPVSGN